MPTRFVIAGMHFFAIAAAIGTVVALFAPIDAVRFLGVVALACAGTGFLVQLYALQRVDPAAYMKLRGRFDAARKGMRTAGVRAAGALGTTPSARRAWDGD